MTALQVVEQRVRPQQRPDAADPGDEHEIVLVAAGRPRRTAGPSFSGCSGPAEGLLERLVPLLPLHLDGLVEQVAGLQVVEHEVEQVDVLDPQARLLLRDVVEQERGCAPGPAVRPRAGSRRCRRRSRCRCPLPLEEVVGDDPRAGSCSGGRSAVSLMGPPGCSGGRTSSSWSFR